MRWCTGWAGDAGTGLQPVGGRLIPGWATAWAVGWPADRVRTVSEGNVALTVIGDCGANNAQLHEGLALVRSGRWRELTAWPGSYLTVARRAVATVVIGDLSGQHPVFWRRADGRLRWATAAVPLAALDGAPLDTTVLAARLACGLPDIIRERSLFSTVKRVPTGHILVLSDDEARTERYEPTEYPTRDLNDAAEAVGAALTLAVDSRLDGHRPVSSDLAGLDSTALACLAARRGRVTAVTFADPRVRDDDLPFARRTARAVAGIDHLVAPGTAQTVYYAGLEDMSRLPFTDAPHAYTVTTEIRRAALDQIAARHSRPGTHFTGAAGDTVLDASPLYLADLLRRPISSGLVPRTATRETAPHKRMACRGSRPPCGPH